MQKLSDRYEPDTVDNFALPLYNIEDMWPICQGYRELACSILLQAVEDWKGYGGKKKTRNRRVNEFLDEVGFDSPCEELLTFFQSRECEGLCDWVDIDYSEVLRKLNIERR